MENNEEGVIKESLDNFVKDRPFRLNPNEKTVAKVIKGLVARNKKYGKLYCPCRIVSGDNEKDDKIICPCFYHEEEVNRDGKCHCDLFVANESE